MVDERSRPDIRLASWHNFYRAISALVFQNGRPLFSMSPTSSSPLSLSPSQSIASFLPRQRRRPSLIPFLLNLLLNNSEERKDMALKGTAGCYWPCQKTSKSPIYLLVLLPYFATAVSLHSAAAYCHWPPYLSYFSFTVAFYWTCLCFSAAFPSLQRGFQIFFPGKRVAFDDILTKGTLY